MDLLTLENTKDPYSREPTNADISQQFTKASRAHMFNTAGVSVKDSGQVFHDGGKRCDFMHDYLVSAPLSLS